MRARSPVTAELRPAPIAGAPTQPTTLPHAARRRRSFAADRARVVPGSRGRLQPAPIADATFAFRLRTRILSQAATAIRVKEPRRIAVFPASETGLATILISRRELQQVWCSVWSSRQRSLQTLPVPVAVNWPGSDSQSAGELLRLTGREHVDRPGRIRSRQFDRRAAGR